jgi:hypothetical protein
MHGVRKVMRPIAYDLMYFTKEWIMKRIQQILIAFAAVLALAGCVAYPYPYPYPSGAPSDPFERPWNAAMGAIGDAGLTLVVADRASGTIKGTRGTVEGTLLVRTRADGRVGVEISARDPNRQDPGLVERLTNAYNARMGR